MSDASQSTPEQVVQERLGDVWEALAALSNIVDETAQDEYIDRQETRGREALTRIEAQLVNLYEQLGAARDTLRHIATAEWSSLDVNEVMADLQALAEHRAAA